MAKKRSLKPLNEEQLTAQLEAIDLPSIEDLQTAYESVRPLLVALSNLWIIPAKGRELIKKFIQYADLADKLV